MARIVISEQDQPMEIAVGGESRWICMCGLSKDRPFCDGAHAACAGEQPGKTYRYVDGKRVEVKP